MKYAFLKKVIFIFCLISLCSSAAFASWDKKAQFRSKHLFHYDFRENNHTYYLNRDSVTFVYLDSKDQPLFKVEPFFEARRNPRLNLWERKEIGVEIGKDVLPWLYVGNALQRGRMKEDYSDFRSYWRRDYFESELRVLVSHNLFDTRLKGFVLNELTYDIEKASAIRNEVAIGLTMPLAKHVEAAVNWRHIDRIHYYDSDTVETSMVFVF